MKHEIIDELFKYLLQNYQKGLEESLRGSNFVFDSVDLLYYHLQKTSLKRTGSSYVDFPEWLKNNDNNCFQYALTVALNYQNIKKDPQRVSKIKPFINKFH